MSKLVALLLLASAAWGQTVLTLFDVKAFGTPATADLTFVVGANTIRGGYGPTGQFFEINAANQSSGGGGANSGYISRLERQMRHENRQLQQELQAWGERFDGVAKFMIVYEYHCQRCDSHVFLRCRLPVAPRKHECGQDLLIADPNRPILMVEAQPSPDHKYEVAE